MKYALVLAALLSVVSCASTDTVKTQTPPENSNITIVCPTGSCTKAQEVQKVEIVNPPVVKTVLDKTENESMVLNEQKPLLISVVGQGVAPINTASPAQAYALAKRAAVADAYRLIAEKVKGVRIDGQDLVQNMMVKRSTVRTSVAAMVRNANIVETTFKEGLCEVEMEITLNRSQFPH
jgi:hypothetical protein